MGILTLAAVLLLTVVKLPNAYPPGLLFRRPQELMAAALLGLTLIGYLRKGEWRRSPFEHWLIMGLIVGLTSQMLMSFSGQLFDAMGTAAHLLEATGYVLVLVGLLIDMHQLYRVAEGTAKTLALRTDELERSKRDLEEQAGSFS